MATEQAKISLLVRPDEVDPYGVVHHSRYAVWAELALCELLRVRAVNTISDRSDELNKVRKTAIPAYSISRFHCKYQLSARQDDSVEVLIRTGKLVEDHTKELFLFQVLDAVSHRLFASGELEVRVVE